VLCTCVQDLRSFVLFLTMRKHSRQWNRYRYRTFKLTNTRGLYSSNSHGTYVMLRGH